MWIAGGSWPYAFGLGMDGDRNDPFPFPESVVAGAIVLAIGLVLLVALVIAVRGSLIATIISSVGLVAVLGGEAVLAFIASEARRCAHGAYIGRDHCTSASTATVRDFLLLSIIPFVAFVSLWISKRAPRRRRPVRVVPTAGAVGVADVPNSGMMGICVHRLADGDLRGSA